MEDIKPVSSSFLGDNTKKYLSPEEYKKRLNKKFQNENTAIENIETKIPKPISTSRYLSPEEYKKRLKGK